MIALIVGASGLVLLLMTGVVLSVLGAVHRDGPATRAEVMTPTSSPRTQSVSAAATRARDELAARPMPDTGSGYEFGYPDLSTRDPGTPIELPPARIMDSHGVATGFPQTTAGALAQLAALDGAALESGSLSQVRALIGEWAAPGGPTARTWSGARSMRALLQSIRASGAGAPSVRIAVTPAMGLVKGTVGSDFTVVCVDFALDVAGHQGAVADCQRMLWTGGRWMIGPGKEPAPAQTVWPDTDAAVEAGFKDLLAAAGPWTAQP